MPSKLTKLEKEYNDLYGNLPDTPEEMITYLQEKYPVKPNKLIDCVNSINDIKWKTVKIKLPIIPHPSPRPRSSHGHFYVKGAKDHRKAIRNLVNAENTLYDIIKEMDMVMKDKFLDTFEKVKVEFKNVYRELFKGGKAELSLTDPDNILETGIEIKAEPPGKKLQSISLLSGGEKTFTAISLLFAILNIRPVPFCLFDEVEAALDDANVEAFGKYLDKYRDNTQFIIITHKKKTMEYADILYGITMEESGVSKIVSVKLEDIKKD